MELIQIALLLLVLLIALPAGGLWIGVTLIVCGYVGMQFAGATIPPGAVLATTIWGNSASWTLAASSFIGVVLFVLAEELFAWFGPGYEGGVPALRILLVGQMIAAAGGSQLHVMMMTGHERSAAVLLVACTIGNLVASAGLISSSYQNFVALVAVVLILMFRSGGLLGTRVLH